MFELNVSLLGALVCVFGGALSRLTGNYQDAVLLCAFIFATGDQ